MHDSDIWEGVENKVPALDGIQNKALFHTSLLKYLRSV